MRMADCICLAAQQLRRRRLRSVLCALSVCVGVTAILLIWAVGVCGQAQVRTAIDQIGLSGLSVYVSQGGAGQALTSRHAAAMASALPAVERAMPVKATTGMYRTARNHGVAILLGIDEQLGEVMGITPIYGTLPTARQCSLQERVAVIDSDLAQTLYGRADVVAQSLRLTIDGTENYFRIVCVIEPQASGLGSALGGIVPSFIYIPYGCLASPYDSTDQVFVQCAADADAIQTGTQIKQFLTQSQHVSGTLAVQDLGGALARANELARLVTLSFLAVAGISFFVALLGVLSCMLSSAYEKTAEIGLFMALGARRRDIMRIFLSQSVLICILGGVCGLCLSALALAGVSHYLHITIAIPLGAAGYAIVLSAICGIAAGLLPALRAARLHPVDAMRR